MRIFVEGIDMKKTLRTAGLSFLIIALACAHALAGPSSQGQNCPVVIPVAPVAVAPNQPAVAADSARGVINALCEFTLNLVRCGFLPSKVTITCDTNGDGVPELMIPASEVTIVNPLLVRATFPVQSPQLPGTAFPLSCCGGTASLTLSRTYYPDPNNVFGEFTQTVTCPIDLGARAPVVISVSPSDGNCSVPQNLIIPGSCFLLADGSPNVTSVFAVERNNPSNVVASQRFVILSNQLIDALFDFGSSNAGKTFLIYASGPNGTSRNLTFLPEGAPDGCPLGNEQGVQVTFTCRGAGQPDPPPAAPQLSRVEGCRVERSSSGSFSLTLTGRFIDGSALTIGGASPKKMKMKDPTDEPNIYSKITVKGKFCSTLPGTISILNPNGALSVPFHCSEACVSQ
jgi:hypothetical protein